MSEQESRTTSFAKIFYWIFKDHRWRVIFGLGFPLNSACVDLYMSILTEATRGRGYLLFSGDRAYEPEELFCLANIPQKEGSEAEGWLEKEKLIDVGADGTISIPKEDADLFFGAKGSNADKCKRYRETHPKPRKEKDGKEDGIEGKREEKSNDSDESTPSPTPETDTGSVADGVATPSGESFSLNNPSIRTRCLDVNNPKAPDGNSQKDGKYEAMAKEFASLYPKKYGYEKTVAWFAENKPSEDEYHEITEAVERFSMSKDWTKEGGKYIPMACNWLAMRPWGSEDLESYKRKQIERRLNEQHEREQKEMAGNGPLVPISAFAAGKQMPGKGDK